MWRTTKNDPARFRDLLIDAPGKYSPDWLESLSDPNLKKHCRQLYLRLKKDSDAGHGVSMLRDVVLKRIVWNLRIIDRVEQAIAKYDKLELAGYEGAEEKLLDYMKFHAWQVSDLTKQIQLVLVDMPPMVSLEQIREAVANTAKVKIPSLDELDL